MRKLVFILTASLCLGYTLTTKGQTLPDNEVKMERAKIQPRPKVGVVFSGGGAKGVAHIGALRVMERAGIPIDLITGTSMGSIVGGLYACGNSTAKLDSIVRAQDWAYVLSDKDDLSHQSLQEREKQNTYIISTSLKLGKNAVTPEGGMIIGKNINTLFNAFTAPYNDSIDFNKLPIPFACVATNIVNNTEYVFHSGVLSVAMRASMSIPGAFSPVRIGDMVLVDGGMRNNFPVDIAKEMGADYIIGVSVQNKPRTPDEITSTGSVLSQIIDVNCKNKFEDNLAITDIPILVDVEGYGSASFSHAAIDTLIRRGEEAAMEHWDELVALAKKLEQGPKTPQPRIFIQRKPLLQPTTYKIGQLRFENMSTGDEAFIRTKFRLKEGDSIDTHRADQITTSMRLDLFYKTADVRIDNNAIPQDDGTSAARINFIGGVKKNNQVSVGLRFDNEEMVALQANAALPFRTKMPMELDFTLRLGKRILAKADWGFHPASFIRPTLSYAYRHNDINIYEFGTKSYNLTYNQHTLQVAPLNFLVRNFNVSIGAEWDYYNFSNLLVDLLPEHQISLPDNKHFFNYYAKVDYNGENEWYFPTRGAKFMARYTYYTDNFYEMNDHTGISEINAMWRMSFALNKHIALRPMLYGRMLFGTRPPLIISNMIGGEWFGHYFEQQTPFPGIGHVEMAWDKLIAAQLQGQVNLTQNNIVLVSLAAGQNSDELKDLLDYRTMLGASASYYYNTMFGPLGATLSYCNLTKKPLFFVNLGFVF